ncbi:tRNA (adenosine(37)-N6)-threonylcarbamoyltransferase complex ATPase subunit type 1 TsaE [Micropruina sp.]|uniref:tRNA (adenosine(37)-N6)-threonylcarbamoyltransferase complex ATPase subunit type 1 TsaE n=1 Tax=Micropruina sp. TaxID=2737536 RepID=UPI0039E3301C
MPAPTVVAQAALPEGGTLQFVRTGMQVRAELDGVVIAALSLDVPGDVARIADLSVRPEHRGRGIGTALVGCTAELLAAQGVRRLSVQPRPHEASWWRRNGFDGHDAVLQRALPVLVEAPTAEAMRALGERLAALLRPGDVIIATGDLGAGKTTLTQGIGAGLAVAGPVISPTFVLSRVHPSTVGGPALVHVDAYRLGSFDELEDLDLEASLGDSVTLIEWGGGIAEGLADDRVEIDIRRGLDPDDETRLVFLSGRGPRWAQRQLEGLR